MWVQTWYLSLISLILLVEKKLSCGDISAFSCLHKEKSEILHIWTMECVWCRKRRHICKIYAIYAVLLPDLLFTLFSRKIYFATIYALSYGEKLSWRVHLWRKNDKYKVCLSSDSCSPFILSTLRLNHLHLQNLHITKPDTKRRWACWCWRRPCKAKTSALIFVSVSLSSFISLHPHHPKSQIQKIQIPGGAVDWDPAKSKHHVGWQGGAETGEGEHWWKDTKVRFFLNTF